MTTAQEPFYKDRFCKAVTGLTDDEWRDVVRTGHIDPTTLARMQENVPVSPDEHFVQRFETFMSSFVITPILDLPREELYEAFERFRDYERSVHPRADFPTYVPTYDRRYQLVEETYRSNDMESFKVALQTLVDFIIHD